MVNSISVHAPSTTANLGSGFDVFGLALDALYDTVEVTLTETQEIEIELSGINANTIPKDPERNTAGIVALEFCKLLNKKIGVKISINKGIKPKSGLGSSAASAAATAFALNILVSQNLSTNQLIWIASQGEKASAGAAHADNVSPCLLGGFTIVRSYEPLDVLHFPPPRNVSLAIVLPEIEYTTREARSVIPENFPLRKITHNVGHAACLVVGMLHSDPALIGKGMSDLLVEPARATLIPGYAQVKRAALNAGAYGAAISGSGPAMIAIVDPANVNALEVANAMKDVFDDEGIPSLIYEGKPTKGILIST